MSTNPTLDAQMAALSTATADLNAQAAALQEAMNNVDPNNPASLLELQLQLSEYENAVYATSQIVASTSALTKSIIQNIS